MKLTAAAMGVAFLGLAVTPAAADTSFDLFKALCADTRGEPAKALAAADATGWSPFPEALLKNMKSSDAVTYVDGRMTLASGGPHMLLLGVTNELAPGVRRDGRICAVGSMSGDMAKLKTEATLFASVGSDAALVTDKRAVAFAWRETNTGRQRVSAAELKTVPWDDSLSLLIAGGTDQDLPIIALAVPTK